MSTGNFSEETCGNKVRVDFEVIDTQWVTPGEKLTYHGWPTLANVGGDKLAIVCSGDREAHICPFGKVLLYESSDKGKTWSAPRVLADGPLDDRDAGLIVTSAGTWLVNYFTSTYFAALNTAENTPPHWKEREDAINLSLLKEEHGFFMMRSTDQGKTWSKKYRIPVNNVHGPVVLKDGSLLYCGRGYSGNCLQAAGFAPDVVAMRSTDDGLTWEELSRFKGVYRDGNTEYNLNIWHELHCIEAEDGTIIMQIRYSSATWQLDSADGGRTWSNLRRVCGGFPSHLMKLSDGRLLMSYGYRAENYGNRCRISSDNGKSWSEPMLLSRNSPSTDLGYPSTVELSDGTLVTVWYELRPELKVASLRCVRWKLK